MTRLTSAFDREQSALHNGNAVKCDACEAITTDPTLCEDHGRATCEHCGQTCPECGKYAWAERGIA